MNATRTPTAAERVRELREEMYATRAKHGRTSGYSLDAFVRYMREAARLGMNPTALQQNSRDEVERFFSHVVPGPDGHSYWTGGYDFKRNDGKDRLPARWWWEHVKSELRHGDSVLRTCEDAKCIAPKHREVQDRAARHRIYKDSQLIGLLQVYALQNGHPPTRDGWDKAGLKPTASVFGHRFGRWALALQAAGLQVSPRGGVAVTREACVDSVRFARTYLGRWPVRDDYRSDVALRAKLKEVGLPTSPASIQKHVGDWTRIAELAK